MTFYLMRNLILLLFLCMPLGLIGQFNWCESLKNSRLTEEDPRYKNFLQKIAGNESSFSNRSEKYVRVVVHVVAAEEFDTLSRAQVLQQLDVLNNDFAAHGENLSKLISPFSSLVSDAGIRFCLASEDPFGQPTSGITFTRTSVNNIALQTGEGGRIAIHYDQLGGKSGWDPSRYLNIWVGEYGDFLGSASFPETAPYPEEIGVVIDIRHFGSIGDAGHSGLFGRGHTLTHEMGHFFGLKHIWGDGVDENCTDTDDIDDTPNASGPYYGCPAGEQFSCETSNMFQNFMDLTDDRCLAAFTRQQGERMQIVLDAYYPELILESSCVAEAESFDQWYDDLVWAYDSHSRKYVIYSEDGWAGEKEVDVFAADGKLVWEGTWEEEWSYLLDLSSVSAGLYYVRIFDGDRNHVRSIAVF